MKRPVRDISFTVISSILLVLMASLLTCRQGVTNPPTYRSTIPPRPCRPNRIKPASNTPPSTAPRKQLLIPHIPNKRHTYYSENSSMIIESIPYCSLW